MRKHLGFILAISMCAAWPAWSHPLLTTHVPDAVKDGQAALAGAVDAMAPVQVQIVLPMRHLDTLKTLVGDITNPQSPLYRHYLSTAEFTKRFGPTTHDYDAAARFFEAEGLSVTQRAANRYVLQVEGRASDVERVLHVSLNLYRHPSENRLFMAPDREPTLDLAVPVLRADGLDDFELPYSKMRAPLPGHEARNRTGSGPKGDFIGSDFRAAYYGNGALTGAGQSVGLFEFHGYDPANVALYFETVGQQNNVPVVGISTDGTDAICSGCADGEQALDIEYAISMAPGLAQVQVYVGRSAIAILNRMASDNSSKQLSVSWGWHKNFEVEDALYQEMAVQGQTMLIASGDDLEPQGERGVAGGGREPDRRRRHRSRHRGSGRRLRVGGRLERERRRTVDRQADQDRAVPACLHQQAQRRIDEAAQRPRRGGERELRHVCLLPQPL